MLEERHRDQLLDIGISTTVRGLERVEEHLEILTATFQYRFRPPLVVSHQYMREQFAVVIDEVRV